MANTCNPAQSSLELLNSSGLPHTCADQPTLNKILSIIFITLGAFAVLMIVIGGLRYIFARSNAESVVKAKNMIVYSLIGLVISALAAAIVNVVLGRLK